jgi:hypothetical protein
MRPLVVVATLLAACSPEISSGAYFCGDERSCPEGQVCDGPSNTCVLAGTASPFACDPGTDPEPDDTAAQGKSIPPLACVSSPYDRAGCLHAGDPADWLTLTAPSQCVAVAVQIRITYPIAFEPLAIELWDLGSNTMIATQGDCASGGTAAGDDSRCLVQTLTPGGSYGVAIKPAGGGDCNGGCAYNRYTVTVQLATPG